MGPIQNGNNVLVYSPSPAQLAAKTVTNGILPPTAVAFDSSGNLAIANAGNNTIVEYTPAGDPNTVIMVRTSQPFAMAFDALDDLWVNNGYSNLTIYAQGLVVPIVSSDDNSNFITGVAAYKAVAVLGGNMDTLRYELNHFLTNQSIPRREVTTET